MDNLARGNVQEMRTDGARADTVSTGALIMAHPTTTTGIKCTTIPSTITGIFIAGNGTPFALSPSIGVLDN